MRPVPQMTPEEAVDFHRKRLAALRSKLDYTLKKWQESQEVRKRWGEQFEREQENVLREEEALEAAEERVARAAYERANVACVTSLKPRIRAEHAEFDTVYWYNLRGRGPVKVRRLVDGWTGKGTNRTAFVTIDSGSFTLLRVPNDSTLEVV